MAKIAKKITKLSPFPKSAVGRRVVYAEEYNQLIDAILELEGSDGNLVADTISEQTSGGGVTIDSVVLKDSTVKTGAGAVGAPAVQVGSTDTGLYQVSGTQTGISQDGVLVAVIDSEGIKPDSLKPRVKLETPNTGVTSDTYGDGVNFTTVLTVSQTDAVVAADNAALASGYKLMDLPAGAVVITSAYMSIGVTMAEDTTATPDVGIGTTIGSGANSVLSGVGAGAENIITGQTAADANGTATVKTIVNQPLAIEVGDSHAIYLNIAATWADTAGVDLTGDIAGTVTIKWTLMA